ncbi:hypothetical protein BU15DRAFT_69760 [Melanogaster broomeanus]|nr:hypothetical protein BU15DRAFT_69760 [Melanogaster broomeanus]
MSTGLPADTKAIRKTEEDIAKESKADDKGYKNALKELKTTEKTEAKASKAMTKAEKNLKKKEDREYEMIKTLQKATHGHDQAVTDLHSAQTDLQIKRQRAQTLRQEVDERRCRVDRLSKEKQAHDKERTSKLASLHTQPLDPPTDAIATGAMMV